MVFIVGSSLALSFAVSFPASAALAKTTVPSAVRAVHATAGNARALLKWSSPRLNGGSPIKKYIVTSHPLNKTCVTSGTKCAISGLANGMPYEFTVVASNKVGSSPNSKPSNVVTPRGLATVPYSPPNNPVAPPTPTTTTSTTTTTTPAPGGGGGGGGGGGTVTPTNYTVTFNANGGSGTMVNETSGSAAYLSANSYTRSGYIFNGWNTSSNGSGTSYAGGVSYPFTSSVTLYAQWMAAYAVTFNSNGGTGSMNNETNTASADLSTNSFTRSGYNFAGWNTSSNGSGTSYADEASYPFTSSVTLYAQWSVVVAPVITLQPANETLGIGSIASFTAAATGPSGTSVQWYESANGSTWSSISGAVSTSYTVTTTALVNDYQYRAVFTDSAGSATSSSATLVNLEASGNWSGYAATGAVYTAVSAQWTVPTVTCGTSSTSYAVQWVGIDGWGSSSVEQDGTETNCFDGTPVYGAWYEMYGDINVNGGYQVGLSTGAYPVIAGDSISSSVSVSGGVWTLQVTDSTEGWAFSTNVTTSAPAQASAEVIVEAPGICTGSCSTAALADFGSATFTNVSVSGSGVAGAITASNYYAVEITVGSVVLALPGSLNPAGTAFTDTWESS